MDPEAGIVLSWPVPTLPLPTRQLASPLTERAGVLWGALDAPVGIRLEVETLAAEQFGDDAFECYSAKLNFSIRIINFSVTSESKLSK